MMNIVMVGGSGFLGQYLVHELVADGHRCTVLSRYADRRSAFKLEKATRLVQADVYDPGQLARYLDGADAVISMAGILNESGFGGRGFRQVHVSLPELLINACKKAGVRRFLHISALNAGKGKSHYLISKGQAEDMLFAQQDLQVTVFQPSVIFGRGDRFFNRFASLLKLAPVMPLACGNSRMQPVYAGDVAAAVAASLDDPGTFGKTYELGGPEVYTLKELVRFTASTLGLKRWIFNLPDSLSRIQGLLLGLVPGKPFSMDNFRSLQTDNVTTQNGLRNFRIVPVAIESIVPDYLGASLRQERLKSIRKKARR
jgi:NADH dehydrogenase